MGKFLSSKQREELLSDHKYEDKKRFADRIKAVLSLDDGFSPQEISKILLLDESTIRRYKKVYLEGGLEELIEDGYKGRVTKMQANQEQELKEHLTKNTYLRTKDIVAHVKENYGFHFSTSGMRDCLHRLNFTYKKPKIVPGKSDIQKQLTFLLYLNDIKKKMSKKDYLYYMDASHPRYNSFASYGWIPKGMKKELKSNSGRQRLNLHGAIEINHMKAIVREEERIDTDSTLSLFKAIEKRHPKARKIYVILDNAAYYWSQEVEDYLCKSKIRKLHLPPYSPNLNLIERLWKFFHKKIQYNKYYSDFKSFEKESMNFFKNLNSHKRELRSLLSEKVEVLGT